MDDIQNFENTWPELKFAWSFIILFAGLIVHTVSTIFFIVVLLIKGERKASKSDKGFSSKDVHSATDKTPMISVIAHENEGFSDDVGKRSKNDVSGSGAYEFLEQTGQATPTYDSVIPDDFQLEDKTDSHSYTGVAVSESRTQDSECDSIVNENGYDSYDISTIPEISYENTVIESSRL